jgi:cytidylate kinase
MSTRRTRPVVAIDGPAGSGKSSVARQVAEELNFTLVDTGALYRCVALAAQRSGIDFADGAGLGVVAKDMRVRFDDTGLGSRVLLDGQDVSAAIRTPQMSQGASKVSAHPEVRAALLQVQREMGTDGGVVLEGRDIGTVVFPDAEVKVFLDASAETRAQRRFSELQTHGEKTSLAETLAEVVERDDRDRNRELAPLRAAEDAEIIDTGPMTIINVVERIAALVRTRS